MVRRQGRYAALRPRVPPGVPPLTRRAHTDKDRENYLGHSILAPVGRWQKNKDITWYNKGKTDEEARALELKQIKEQEEDALAVALCVPHLSSIVPLDTHTPIAEALLQLRARPPARPPRRPRPSTRTLPSSPRRPRTPQGTLGGRRRTLARRIGQPGARRRPRTRTGTTSRPAVDGTATTASAGTTASGGTSGTALRPRVGGRATSARMRETVTASDDGRGHLRHHRAGTCEPAAGGTGVGPPRAGDEFATAPVFHFYTPQTRREGCRALAPTASRVRCGASDLQLPSCRLAARATGTSGKYDRSC